MDAVTTCFPLPELLQRLDQGNRECCLGMHARTMRLAAEALRSFERERAALRAEVWRLQDAVARAGHS